MVLKLGNMLKEGRLFIKGLRGGYTLLYWKQNT